MGFSKIASRFRRKRVPNLVILAQICGCERFFVMLKGFSERFENRHASDLVFCRALFCIPKNPSFTTANLCQNGKETDTFMIECIA